LAKSYLAKVIKLLSEDKMSQNEDSENSNYQPLDRLIISDFDSYTNNHWSPCIEKQLLEELKSPTKISAKTKTEKNLKSENKVICLLIGLLALLSVGLCIQADSIAQTLREAARISVLQIYSKY
jgi:hypothetical protein